MKSLFPAMLGASVVALMLPNPALHPACSVQANDATPANQRLARPTHDWVKCGVMYQIQPRAFTPEGTLKAATARLPKLAALGIDILYMCPVFVSDDDPNLEGWSPRQKKSKMNNARNPYRMMDYYHVDPEYGTDDDLKQFIVEAHRLGMRVLLDMVYLHCGPNAVFLDEHPNFVKRDKDGSIVTAAWGFPAVNHANAELREYLWKNMEYWVEEFGADGFRCDVSDAVPLDFWETARERLEKIRPDICILAEGSRRSDQLKAFDLNYSFAWYRVVRRVGFGDEPASAIRKSWESIAAEYPRGARFIRYIDNHDIANDSYNVRIEKSWGYARVNAMLAMLFTLDGVPMLYNGQEVADTARHSIFGRAPIDWAAADTPKGEKRWAFCQELCAMRHKQRALTHGDVVWLENDQPDAIASFLRSTPEETVLSVLNLSEHSVAVRLKMPESVEHSWDTLISDGVRFEANGRKTVLNLEGFGYAVAKHH